MRPLLIQAFLGLALSLPAFAVSTDPVGAMKVTALGNSDTILGVPFHRPAIFEGRINSIASDIITVDGTPGWTADEFVYDNDAVTDHYYVLIASGDKEGSFFTVTANGEDTLTLNLNGDSLDTVATTAVDGTGDIIRIIPYWTLNTVFPGGEGLTTNTDIINRESHEILIPDVITAGVNLAPSLTYFYYTGGLIPDGWYNSSSLGVPANNTILYPDTYFIVRNKTADPFELIFAGSVQMASFSLPLTNLANNTQQDNFLNITVPIEITLNDSNLYQSGAFTASNDLIGPEGDLFLVFDNNQVAKNKSPAVTYIYYTGGLIAEGWYNTSALGIEVGDTATLTPGQGFIIRKAGTSQAETKDWSGTPPYLQ